MRYDKNKYILKTIGKLNILLKDENAMKIKEKTTYKECCNTLDEGCENKIGYVRDTIKKKYGNDLDKLLQIKAEALADDPNNNASLVISVSSCVVSVLTLLYTVVQGSVEGIALFFYGIIILSTMIFWGCVVIRYNKKMGNTWRKYILVVIDDLIEECQNKER